MTKFKHPLKTQDLQQFRFVVIRDSVQDFPEQCTQIYTKLPVLTVPTVQDKIEAIQKGIGVGFLPDIRANALVKTGDLVTLPLDKAICNSNLYLAWKAKNKSKALHWFIAQLTKEVC